MSNKYFYISCLMHVSLILLTGIAFHFFKNPPKIMGDEQSSILTSFIYHEIKPMQQNVTKIEKHKTIKPIQPKKTALALQPPTLNVSEHTQSEASVQKSVQSEGETVTNLVALLHDAIQEKQVYPPSAVEMHREGSVTVAFTLDEYGAISNLRIISSSGTLSLDHAALKAVNEAAPFSQLIRYIKHSDEYKIAINYQLG